MDLHGATALVTGAGARLGRVIAIELADAGANVAISYRSSIDVAAETVAELEGRGVAATAVELDISQAEACSAAVVQVEDRLGPIDLLVNNASAFAPTPFPTDDHRGWLATFDVVLHGPYYLANAVATGMIERRQGAIINIVDLSAWHPWPDRGAHSVAKSALLALTRQLAVELAPHVRANAVAPGPTIPADSFDAEQIDRLAARTLRGTWGDPRQVGAAVRFLAESDFVTGDCITVDGGERWGHVRTRFA